MVQICIVWVVVASRHGLVLVLYVEDALKMIFKICAHCISEFRAILLFLYFNETPVWNMLFPHNKILY